MGKGLARLQRCYIEQNQHHDGQTHQEVLEDGQPLRKFDAFRGFILVFGEQPADIAGQTVADHVEVADRLLIPACHFAHKGLAKLRQCSGHEAQNDSSNSNRNGCAETVRFHNQYQHACEEQAVSGGKEDILELGDPGENQIQGKSQYQGQGNLKAICALRKRRSSLWRGNHSGDVETLLEQLVEILQGTCHG
ncbi:hypothetical protein D3C75_666560 [compost metagenome]